MKEALYRIVGWIARMHSLFLKLNDRYERSFTDKELHFLVIGVLGMLLIFVIYPLFRYLAERGHAMVITGIYVLTLLIGITFAIEIGQGITRTGSMEFGDIAFGLFGFLAMFGVFLIGRAVFRLVVKAFSSDWNKE